MHFDMRNMWVGMRQGIHNASTERLQVHIVAHVVGAWVTMIYIYTSYSIIAFSLQVATLPGACCSPSGLHWCRAAAQAAGCSLSPQPLSLCWTTQRWQALWMSCQGCGPWVPQLLTQPGRAAVPLTLQPSQPASAGLRWSTLSSSR